jgi:hypothetical protein
MGWPTAGEGGEWLPIFFMTRAIKLFSLLSVLIMLGVGLAACGGSSSSSFSAEDTMAVPAAEEAAPALTGYEQFVDTSMLRL